MHVEPLHPRRLLSADIFHVTSSGTLMITGTSADDRILVQLKGGKRSYGLIATLESANRGAETTSVSYQFDAKYFAVKRIRIAAGEGDDLIFVSGAELTRPVTVLGGEGNDVIQCSLTGAAHMDGGSGDDVVGATKWISVDSTKNRIALDKAFSADGGAVNTILGGSGNDELSGDINDQIDGGAGTDQAVLLLSSSKHISRNRANALAHDYFRRLGAIHIEAKTGQIASPWQMQSPK